MIKRIVKMEFQSDKVEDFKTIFRNSCSKIKSRPGCRHVECLQDLSRPNLFFTYSVWDKEADLQAYRESELFADVWARTKALFSGKPEAWSVMELND